VFYFVNTIISNDLLSSASAGCAWGLGYQPLPSDSTSTVGVGVQVIVIRKDFRPGHRTGWGWNRR